MENRYVRSNDTSRRLVKIYKTKQTEVLALQGLDLTVEAGELTALIGNSGSGKSTFLNMIGGLDRPSAGSLTVCGKNLFKMSEKELVEYKRDTVGFVWQNNGRNLLPYLSALENVMLPMHLSDKRKKKEKALELLERVGMETKKNSKMSTMSGGEQQRGWQLQLHWRIPPDFYWQMNPPEASIQERQM